MISIRQDIAELQRAQAAMLRAVAAVQSGGSLGRAVQYAITAFHRYKTAITHVDTGAYRAAGTIQFSGLRAVLFTSPDAVNPRSGQRPAEYQHYEELRGGSHAAWARTANEQGDAIMRRAVQMFEEELNS